MRLDSALADIQLPGNELVALAFGKEREDFKFPGGELILAEAAGQLCRALGRDKHFSCVNGSDAV